jgi:putative ABC transport system permease protein
MFQLFLIAVRNLLQHRKRTLLLGGAIAGVTMLLVTLLGLSNGMREVMFRSATTLMTGHLNVGGFYKVSRSQSAPLVTDYAKVVDIVQKNVPELSYLTVRGRGWGKLISETGAMQAGLGGVDIAKEQGFRAVVQLVSGKLEDLTQPNTVLIFQKQADKLGVKTGDSLTISAPTPRGVNNTIDVRIVAVARDVGLLSSFNVFLPTETLQRLYQLQPSSTGAVYLYLKNIDDIPAVQQRLRDVFKREGYGVMDDDPRAFWQKFEVANREDWTGQKLDITNWETEVSFLKWVITAIDSLTGALTFVLLVIIAVGIMNSLWIAIRERTREIGTLRAIGMQRLRVLAMFVIEAFTLGLSATVVGAFLGILFCVVLNAAHINIPISVQLFLMSDTLFLAVVPSKVVGSIALITFCTTAISLIPSFLAARLKPITAMHHLG